MARFSLLNRIRRRRGTDFPGAPAPIVRRAPSPGALRRERRAILKGREERIRDLGGLTLEMYRRSTFRDELLLEHCREIVALEDRLRELDSMLAAVAGARRAATACECGAPIPWGSHFCANCGRPVGAEPIVACEFCGHPLPADAKFCAGCGRPSRSDAEGRIAALAGSDEHEPGADPWER
ncbi:MAG: zinc ribbon domain-containing protein [Gaiellaceae bacterium]